MAIVIKLSKRKNSESRTYNTTTNEKTRTAFLNLQISENTYFV